MAGKLWFLVGVGAGYVLGARAGRARYEQIAAKAQGVWHDPRVQDKTEHAQQVVKDKGAAAAAVVAEKAAEAGAKVAEKVKEKVSPEETGETDPTRAPDPLTTPGAAAPGEGPTSQAGP
ncbi:hypothetical protein [Nocardioides insulae]|uniref:hypothetical protein n=1 Tax=Nocardioides insulae TaxID=394734 RepID=UPI000414AE3C|nr:hypothetical protein [Nocardioides insulae]